MGLILAVFTTFLNVKKNINEMIRLLCRVVEYCVHFYRVQCPNASTTWSKHGVMFVSILPGYCSGLQYGRGKA